MVDRLKRSLEVLEPPVCPNCHIEMKWSRSTLIAQDPTTIAHLFVCPNCRRVVDTTSVLQVNSMPHSKLSAPGSTRIVEHVGIG